MRTMPKVLCSSDHEWSSDTSEEPETVRFMLGVLVRQLVAFE